MLIDFNSIPETVVPNMRGGVGVVRLLSYADEKTKIMKLTLAPGFSIGLHTHVTDCEVVYVLSGSGKMLCDGGEELLTSGLCHYCPKGHTHSLVNTGTEDLIILGIVPQQP